MQREEKYTKERPRWVQADHVVAASADETLVHVMIGADVYLNCRSQWDHPEGDPRISNVLTYSATGREWLSIWFWDSDVMPFSVQVSAELARQAGA
jgi:hypothetical protein